jgi:hypothetical protein
MNALDKSVAALRNTPFAVLLIVECPNVTDLLKGCELKDQFRNSVE